MLDNHYQVLHLNLSLVQKDIKSNNNKLINKSAHNLKKYI